MKISLSKDSHANDDKTAKKEGIQIDFDFDIELEIGKDGVLKHKFIKALEVLGEVHNDITNITSKGGENSGLQVAGFPALGFMCTFQTKQIFRRPNVSYVEPADKSTEDSVEIKVPTDHDTKTVPHSEQNMSVHDPNSATEVEHSDRVDAAIEELKPESKQNDHTDKAIENHETEVTIESVKGSPENDESSDSNKEHNVKEDKTDTKAREAEFGEPNQTVDENDVILSQENHIAPDSEGNNSHSENNKLETSENTDTIESNNVQLASIETVPLLLDDIQNEKEDECDSKDENLEAAISMVAEMTDAKVIGMDVLNSTQADAEVLGTLEEDIVSPQKMEFANEVAQPDNFISQKEETSNDMLEDAKKMDSLMSVKIGEATAKKHDIDVEEAVNCPEKLESNLNSENYLNTENAIDTQIRVAEFVKVKEVVQWIENDLSSKNNKNYSETAGKAENAVKEAEPIITKENNPELDERHQSEEESIVSMTNVMRKAPQKRMTNSQAGDFAAKEVETVPSDDIISLSDVSYPLTEELTEKKNRKPVLHEKDIDRKEKPHEIAGCQHVCKEQRQGVIAELENQSISKSKPSKVPKGLNLLCGMCFAFGASREENNNKSLLTRADLYKKRGDKDGTDKNSSNSSSFFDERSISQIYNENSIEKIDIFLGPCQVVDISTECPDEVNLNNNGGNTSRQTTGGGEDFTFHGKDASFQII